MKLLLLLLGYHSNHTPFYLYQIPNSTILLFKVSDISTLFNVSDITCHPSLNKVPTGECFCINNFRGEQQQQGEESNGQLEYFLSTQVLSRTAVALNRYRLAELCKLKPNDYVAGLADSILKNITTFERAKDEKSWNLMDLPLSLIASPVPSPKHHVSIASATTSTLSNNNTNANQQQGALESPRAQLVKSEPRSPPPLRLSQPKEIKDDQRPPNTMAIGKVLWSKTAEKRSPSTRPTADDDASYNKRQRTEVKVLPKPAHTVSSQQSHPHMMNTLTSGQGQTLLSKRQGKNPRHLTIFAPSYADPLSAAIRSAPLDSNFTQQQQQEAQKTGITATQQHHQQPQQPQQHHQHISTTLPLQGYQVSVRHPPKTANMLQPRHALAPLLSPRAVPANLSHRHNEPKTTGGAIGKQEFAIPPIVPSQQQPPHTAHPHHSSGNATHYHQGLTSSSTPSALGRPASLSSSAHQSHSKPVRLEPMTTTTRTALGNSTIITPMPPQTPTAYSFAELQRQQFLQPFEHLFDTIETTRTLKTTLDDQIRRSSTLLQTLQASSTTVEGLVRSHVKQMQKDMSSRLDQILDSMIKRIGPLESKMDMTDVDSATMTSSAHRSTASATPAPPPSDSFTAIANSQNDVGQDGYHSILNTLRERLDRLESQADK